MADQELTNSESKLIRLVSDGKCADFTSDKDKEARACIIRDLFLGTNPSWRIGGAVWIKGANIVGTLDLMGVLASHGLRLENCCLLEGASLTLAELQFCSITDSAAKWFVARNLKAGSLSLDGTAFSSIIDVRSARIASNFSCVNTRCVGIDRNPALNAQQIRVEGSMLLGGLNASGAVTEQGVLDLSGAIIEGQLSLNDAKIVNTAGAAIMADSLKVGTLVFMTKGVFCGGVSISNAKIGGPVFCIGSQFVAGRTGEAFVADAADVGGSLQLGSPFGGNAPAELTTYYIGLVRLPRAKIGDNLDCDRASFMLASKLPAAVRSDGPPEVIAADGIDVRGAVRFREACLCGAVGLPSAKIGGDLDFSGAKFCGPSGLVAEHASVGGRFLWRKISLNQHTELDLLDAKVSILADDEQSWPNKGKLIIDGLTYDRLGFDSPTDPTSRLDWLGRMRYQKPEAGGQIAIAATSNNSASLRDATYTQPYRQLVKVLRDEGRDQFAQMILVGLARRQWKHCEDNPISRLAKDARTRISRPAGGLYRIVGYGYRPLPGTISLAILIVSIGWLFCHLAAANIIRLTTKDTDPLSPFWYSLDVFLPTHPLHQVDHWWPKVDIWRWCFCSPRDWMIPWGWWMRLWIWFETLSGWAVTGLFITGVTGIVRRE